MVTSTIDGASALDAAYKSLKDKAESLEKQIGALNIAFNKGNISVEEYTQKLLDLSIQKFTLDMQEGSKSLKDFNKSTREVEIQNLATQINYGRISLEYFQEVTNRFSAQKLVEEFNTGKISAAALNEELARLQGNLDLMDSNNYLLGFKAGVSKSLLEIGNVATMVTDITSNAFKNFEDNMVSMISESKFDFTSFVDSLLADITRLVVRMAVTAPILQGFMNMMSGGGAGFSFGGGGKVGQVAMPFAKGGAFNSGVQFFANGGVVNSPTLFGHSQGMGVMGEAGPEAILPLKRGADGSLGVGAAGVVINVINQSESEIKTTESTSADGGRMIEIMILGKVKEGFANGSFDQSLKQSFGLQRKGV
jgi:phage-related minor tail protein